MFVDVEGNAGAPAGATEVVVAGAGFDGGEVVSDVEFGEAGKGVGEDAALEFALVAEREVAEFGTACTVRRVPVDGGFRPNVVAAFLVGFDDAERFGACEALLDFGDAREDAFSGRRVGDEHGATVVTGNADAAVRDIVDGKFDELTGGELACMRARAGVGGVRCVLVVTHGASLGGVVAGVGRVGLGRTGVGRAG